MSIQISKNSEVFSRCRNALLFVRRLGVSASALRTGTPTRHYLMKNPPSRGISTLHKTAEGGLFVVFAPRTFIPFCSLVIPKINVYR